MRTFLLLLCAGLASGEILDLAKLVDLSAKLRADDNRLMRPSPSEETAKLQTEICPDMIPSLVETLTTRTESLAVRSEAAEVLHLCTTDNPANRAAIGAQGSGETGVAVGLRRVISDCLDIYHDPHSLHKDKRESTRGIAKAAEAVWILSYNDAGNVEKFFEAGILDVMNSVVLTCYVDFDNDESICSQAVMWSLAAMQNMAATYCETDDGSCEWEWNDDKELVLTTPAVSDIGEKVRHRLFEIAIAGREPNLANIVGHFTCRGPVHMPHGPDHPWPSAGDPDLHKHQPSIVPWAAAGFIKNLALDPHAREALKHRGFLLWCLCAISKTSPDWLEEVKANDALYNIGWVSECPDIHFGCEDIKDWKEKDDGLTCLDFENDRLCAEKRTLEDDSGVAAKDACCVCGGGIRETRDEL